MKAHSQSAAVLETLENRRLLSSVTTVGEAVMALGQPVVGDSSGRTIASDGNGAFIAVGNGDGEVTGTGRNLYASLRTADGTIAREGVINSAHNVKRDPNVDMDSAGRFVVAWWGGSTDRDQAVRVQVFDRQFNPLSGEIIVATASRTVSTYGLRDPRVAMDETGGFVVSWMQRQSKTSDFDVYVRRYTNLGANAGKSSVASAATTGDQSRPMVDMAPNGSFIATYSTKDANASSDIRAQRFSSTGTKTGAEIVVAASTDEEFDADVALVPGTSDFVAAWTRGPSDGSHAEVRARRFASTGAALGAADEVLGSTSVISNAPRLAASAEGNVLLVWQHRQSTIVPGVSSETDTSIMALGFDAQFQQAGEAQSVADEHERVWIESGVRYQEGARVLGPSATALGPGQFLTSFARGDVGAAGAWTPQSVRQARTLSIAPASSDTLFSQSTIKGDEPANEEFVSL